MKANKLEISTEKLHHESVERKRMDYRVQFLGFGIAYALLVSLLVTTGYYFTILTYTNRVAPHYTWLETLAVENGVGLAIGGVVFGLVAFGMVTCLNGGAMAQRNLDRKRNKS
jgi:hypothetical protein